MKTKKRKPGRPPIGVIRRYITITPKDLEYFRRIGLGNISAGVRYLAQIARKQEIGVK